MRPLLLKNGFFAFLFLIFLGIGFFGAHYYVQHPGQFRPSRYSTEEILRTRALTHRLHEMEYQNAHLESELTELKLQTTGLYQEQAYQTSQRLARFLGQAPQNGSGVEVVLKDSSKPLFLDNNPNLGIVHNTDLLQVVNELRAAGAKAIAINDQPVMGNTAIYCDGPIIFINQTRIVSPFRVVALGNPKTLTWYLNKPDGFLRELRQAGIEIKVSQRKIGIPAYTQDNEETLSM